jgi:hypothetical protein
MECSPEVCETIACTDAGRFDLLGIRGICEIGTIADFEG